MALAEFEQVKREVERSKQILITFPRDFSVDAVASSLALYFVLRQMGKRVDIVADAFAIPEQLKFLPGVKEIGGRLANLQKFLITLDLTKDSIEELSYNIDGDKLHIHITPKQGTFTPGDVAAEPAEYKYDLIFSLGSPDFESLGDLFKQATDFFYQTTIVNIDHQAANDQFGQINLTDPNAVATAENLYRLIQQLGEGLVDKDVATCLLTGLIAATRSFKTVNVTPATLEVAGQLLEAGADRDAIVKSLYRSRSLATLNLWGRVLSRLKSDLGNRLTWSLVSEQDFLEAGATTSALPEVIDELISAIPGVEAIAILFQHQGKISCLLRVLRGHNARFLAKPFSPTGTKQVVRFPIEAESLQQAEQMVIDQLKQQLGSQEE